MTLLCVFEYIMKILCATHLVWCKTRKKFNKPTKEDEKKKYIKKNHLSDTAMSEIKYVFYLQQL